MGKTCYRKHQQYVERFTMDLFDQPKDKKTKEDNHGKADTTKHLRR